VVLRRPDPQALWLKAMPEKWAEAHATFERTNAQTGTWKNQGVPLLKEWQIELGGIQMIVKPTSFKHVGIFPEQASNWEWLREAVSCQVSGGREVSVLNLFGYTGGASIVCAKAGAKVTHVDSSKSAITWARENALKNNIESIRWILEDAFEFVKKEIKRGNRYDCVIMDPPSFGHGTKGEIWKIEKQFTDLVADVKSLLSDSPVFFLISGYAAGYSSIAYMNNILDLEGAHGGEVEHGELTIEEGGEGRLLPCGIYARWKKC